MLKIERKRRGLTGNRDQSIHLKEKRRVKGKVEKRETKRNLYFCNKGTLGYDFWLNK